MQTRSLLVLIIALGFGTATCHAIWPFGDTPKKPTTTKVNCAGCRGTGRISGVCAVCKGTGQRMSGLFNPVECRSCGGSGSVSMHCHDCGGTGRVVVTQ